ncbi:MAG: peptidylprolyl isomerase [Oscillospiraceae bacterium]
MSASREKRERQGGDAFGLTEKQKQDRKEADQQKRKNIIYGVIGAISAILVAALLIWYSGIFQRNQTALTVNGEKYQPADVDFFYYQALQQQYSYDQQMAQIMTQSGQEYTPSFDPTQDLTTQFTAEDATKSYHDLFLESAKKMLSQNAALYDAAVASGATLSEEGKKQVDDQMAELKKNATANNSNDKAYIKLIYGKYMTPARYRASLERATLVSEFYTAQTEPFKNFTDAELDAYYKEQPALLNSYDFSIAYIDGALPTKDKDDKPLTHTDAEKASAMSAAKLNAEKMVEAVKGGQTFAEAAPLFVAEADKPNYTMPGATLAVAQLGNTLKQQGAYYADWLTDAQRKADDIDLFEAPDQGYFIIQYGKAYRVDEKTVSIRHSLYGAAPVDDPETADVDESKPVDDPATADIDEANPVDDPATADVDESVLAVTPAQRSAAKAKAEAALKEWQDGEKTAETFGTIAERDSIDGGSNTNGGLYANVKKDTMFPAFDAWIFDPARKEGDTTVLENPQKGQEGWHVIYFQSWNDPAWKAAATSAKGTAMEETWLKDLEKGYDAVDAAGLKYVGD